MPNLNRIKWQTFLTVCLLATIAVGQNAFAVDKIYPTGFQSNFQNETGNIIWYRDVIPNEGYAEVTRTKPRGWYENGKYVEGNASLEFQIRADNINQWVFYSRYAGNNTNGKTSWGLLSNVNSLSFDWLRIPIKYDSTIEETPPVDWQEKSPVLRLYINDPVKKVKSELIWENWYNTSDYDTSITNDYKLGAWNEENLTEQNFWRHIFETDLYTTIDLGDQDGELFGGGYGLMAMSLTDWVSFNTPPLESTGTYYYYDSSAYIYGIGVGVGSGWQYSYTGFVDNIYLDFNDGSKIYDNFELPVPEPSSVVLFMFGLFSLIAGRISQRRRTR